MYPGQTMKTKTNLQALCYIAALFAMVLFSGCTIPLFQHPLVAPSEAKKVDSIYGVYWTQTGSKAKSYEKVESAGANYPPGFIRFFSPNQNDATDDRQSPSAMIGFLEPVGDYYILNVPLTGTGNGEGHGWQDAIKESWDESKVVGYLLFRLKVTKNTLELALLEPEAIEECIKSKKLDGSIKQNNKLLDDGTTEVGPKEIIVTSKPDKLRKFFLESIEGAIFSKNNGAFQRETD